VLCDKPSDRGDRTLPRRDQAAILRDCAQVTRAADNEHSMTNQLILPEELLLLSVEKDREAAGNEDCQRALATAMVAELALHRRVAVQPTRFSDRSTS
jgi:hypothetical protein